ncbi:transcription factor IIIC subunit delta N-term-domain-containing protein [Aspergillus desertorum]
MLEPLELQVFPSSYDCISWSEDGEIAVAAGEYVHVLTPKISSKKEANGTTSNASSIEWHRTRFRANVFTINEWPVIFPQPRDYFSIGAEQSFSTVAGIGWSPPGLARYRRSVLAVLTSNMVLTIYAPTNNSGKWRRIAIINKALENFFYESIVNDTLNSRTHSFCRDIEDNTARTRKTNIRAFTWLPPLKVPAENDMYPGPESRWGVSLLAITNEDNDLVFLHVQPSSSDQASQEALGIAGVSVVSLPTSAGFGQALQFHSLLAQAIRSQVRSLYLSSGPWLYQAERRNRSKEDPISAIANVATVQGANLRVVKLSVKLEPQARSFHDMPRYKLTFNATENVAVPVERMDFSFTGPIHWARHMGTGRVSMAVGARAKLAWIDLPESIYEGQKLENADTKSYGFPIMVESTDGISSTSRALHERISGMTVAIGAESDTPTLHLGSVGGYAAVMPLAASGGLSTAPWSDKVEDVRDRFDIDRDLGGLAIARIWGLASQQGLIAAAVTLHPGDMVEYRTNAEDRLTVVFSTATGQPVKPEQVSFLHESPTSSPEFLSNRRDFVLQYILGNHTGTENTLSPKVLYAAACCAIVQTQSAELIVRAREILKRLSASSGTDLSDEIARCSDPGGTLEAKSAEALNAPGGSIFEKCSVCDAGIAWYSAQEAQCANGHVFVRCNLTFLAIQEPGISKLCSRCESEYLDQDLVGPAGQDDIQKSCKTLSDVFDTCVYCNGKFRS